MDELKRLIRMNAAANTIREFSSDEDKAELLEKFKNSSSEQLELMASISGIRKEHLDIFKKQIRGEKNSFTERLNSFSDELKPGDIILVAGKSASSKALIKAQRRLYSKAQSSHVALVHADFICIDAMPTVGVSCRLIHDVLSNVEDNWRVIRFNPLTYNDYEKLMKKCSYYLNQPYKIIPSKKPAKKYSYCSELARKVYEECEIHQTGIPKNRIIKPADFDRLADSNGNWSDVTNAVKPFIEFCVEFDDITSMLSHAFVTGLELNRQRFSERTKLRTEIKKLEKEGSISRDALRKLQERLNEMEGTLNHQFWDFQR